MTPFVLRALPTADSDVSAARLLDQVRASQDLGWSGFVETDGTLQLPDADRFSDVGALLGEQTRLRVWWRDADHWRVDQLLVAGETDLVNKGDRTTEWDYEHAEATISRDPDIRLPRSADLVPPELARRFLRGVDDGDVTRLPVRRVAGASAPGLRIVPSSELSSIDHVDLWADPDSGVPLRVEVYAGADRPAFTSAFRTSRPNGQVPTCWRSPRRRPRRSASTTCSTSLMPPTSTHRCCRRTPPPGSQKTSASDGAVGVYGRGLTQVIAHPAARPRGRRAARPARRHPRGRPSSTGGPWSPSGRSA